MQHIIGGICLMLIGLFLVWKPCTLWRVTESWKQLGAATMSPLFRLVCRVVGTVCLVTGALVCFGILK